MSDGTHAIASNVAYPDLLALPDEVLFAVMAMCGRRHVSLLRVGAACRRLYRLSEDNALWKPIAVRLVGSEDALPSDIGSSYKTFVCAAYSTTVSIDIARTDYMRRATEHDPFLVPVKTHITVPLARVATPFRLACAIAGMHPPMRVHIWLKSKGRGPFRLVYAPPMSHSLMGARRWWASMISRSTTGGAPPCLSIVAAVIRVGRPSDYDDSGEWRHLGIPPCAANAIGSAPADLDADFPQMRYASFFCPLALAHLEHCACSAK
ncbi:F-box domain containing protein [Pandoravirus salinus]|uniref:F-box domain containing protein n=1 Tax=Pandoravirus salinus TaxID=1349410 RepID=S4W1Y7_9VIRU|nr:F-box domain [Pandoravirus salinus]AGO84447.1 F-box domain containing protein [Pandoravirus salinus]